LLDTQEQLDNIVGVGRRQEVGGVEHPPQRPNIVVHSRVRPRDKRLKVHLLVDGGGSGVGGGGAVELSKEGLAHAAADVDHLAQEDGLHAREEVLDAAVAVEVAHWGDGGGVEELAVRAALLDDAKHRRRNAVDDVALPRLDVGRMCEEGRDLLLRRLLLRQRRVNGVDVGDERRIAGGRLEERQLFLEGRDLAVEGGDLPTLGAVWLGKSVLECGDLVDQLLLPRFDVFLLNQQLR
jgi:hypothetical protein